MTLIQTLAAPWIAYQCSDYCLSDPTTGSVVRVDVGTKQIKAIGQGWAADFAFTGVARAGSHQTQTWISSALAEKHNKSSLSEILSFLAESGSKRLRFVNNRWLSICVLGAIADSIRFSLVSNFESLDARPRQSPLAVLKVSSIVVTRPRVFIHGKRRMVLRSDRRMLAAMLRNQVSREEIWNAMQKVNERAADRDPSISRECLLTEVTTQGQISNVNVGGTSGSPDIFFGGINIIDWVKKNFSAARGSRSA